MPISTVPPAEIAARAKAGPIALIDVRTGSEFRSVHAVGARHIPLDSFDPATLDKAQPVHLICHSGVRAAQAAKRCAEAGITDVVVVEGGTKAWEAAGLAVERGASGFGVERQVRLVIGLGVLSGALLAVFVDPAWAWLSGFFGAGLVMAAVTDLCPLALLVAAMPWNRACTPGGTCCVPAVK